MAARYQKLEVWQKSMQMVERAYLLSKALPADERFGLCTQLQRSAVSMPANVAEGYGRTHRGDYLHHLSMARGSLFDLETHVTLAGRMGFVSRKDALPLWSLAQETGRMLNALIASLKRDAVLRKPRTLRPAPRTLSSVAGGA